MPESIATLYHLQKTANFYLLLQCGIQLVNSQLRIKKLQSDTYVIDPVRTPGIVHTEYLGAESAKTTEELLNNNNENMGLELKALITANIRPSFIIVPPAIQDLEDEAIFKKCPDKQGHFRNI
ncbi:hypothetical protein F4823DRAFT_569159 [Ustulina deusta]|nr:hypothetical protein F4823DRAFT_569159 [Ustulina deusta]